MPEERRLGMIFGLLGAALIVVAGIVRAIGGTLELALGHAGRAIGAWEGGILFLVVGGLIGFFALFGRSGPGERGHVSGAVLVVLAVVGWLLLGFGSGLLALLGTVLTLVGGVVYLVAGR